MDIVCPLGGIELLQIHFELIGYVDAADDQHLLFDLDLTDRFRGQIAFACRDTARLQRASEGAGQSTGCGGDYIVERGGVSGEAVYIVLVPLSDL